MESVVSALREGGGGVVGLVNASILAADMADLTGEVGRAIGAGADWIHVDVVDNHFAKVRASRPVWCGWLDFSFVLLLSLMLLVVLETLVAFKC